MKIICLAMFLVLSCLSAKPLYDEPKLLCKEVERLLLPDYSIMMVYQFTPKDLPAGQRFYLEICRPGVESERASSAAFVIENDRVLQHRVSSNTTEDFGFALVAMGYGQPITFALVSEDGKIRVEAEEIIPHPIKAKGQDGAQIFIRASDFSGEIFECHFEGFRPDEKIKFKSQSEDEILEKALTNPNNMMMSILPAVIGKKSGLCTLQFIREKEILEVRFVWGENARFPAQHQLRLTSSKRIFLL
jgi:hypothetical protein